jgi:hypothetical protein
MRFLTTILFLIFVLTAKAQSPQLVMKSFVKKDSVLLRWAPASAELMLLGLKNGYIIERVNSSENFESSQSKKTITVAPFSERQKKYTDSQDPTTLQFAEFLSGMLESSNLTADDLSMAYFSLILGSSVNRTLAEMMGLFTVDLPEADNTFLYRVSIQKSTTVSAAIEVNSAVVDKHPAMTMLAGSARTKLKQAYLSWEAVSLQNKYAAYWIERSTDSINFEVRNQTPYFFFKSQDEPNKMNCDYVDTGVVEGVTYYYRVRGINDFAEKGAISNVVKVYIPKSIYGEVHIDSVSASGFDRKINGEFVDYRPKNEIKKFVLMRSDSIAYGYQFLAEQNYATNQFSFTATVPISSGDRYYYKVAAISPDNDTVYSFPYYFFTLDQIPPSVPVGLHGVVNDSGVVRLAWKLNPENDIRGYRVFWANSLKEEFVEATKVFCIDSVFYDTLGLNNLTSEIYYQIVAVDLNYNNSKKCEPVKLLKPDTIAPVAAVFTDYLAYKKGVYLSWNNSSSKDVVGSTLLRKKDNRIDTLIHWSDTTSHFIDSTGISGEKYAYFILTADNSQNKTVSAELNVNYETGTRAGVTDISFAVNRELKQIELFWKLPQQEIYSIQIYRAKNEGGFILYKTLRDPKAVSFIDQDLSMNNTYRYKIKVVYKSGVSSVLSKEITAIY